MLDALLALRNWSSQFTDRVEFLQRWRDYFPHDFTVARVGAPYTVVSLV